MIHGSGSGLAYIWILFFGLFTSLLNTLKLSVKLRYPNFWFCSGIILVCIWILHYEYVALLATVHNVCNCTIMVKFHKSVEAIFDSIKSDSL